MVKKRGSVGEEKLGGSHADRSDGKKILGSQPSSGFDCTVLGDIKIPYLIIASLTHLMKLITDY